MNILFNKYKIIKKIGQDVYKRQAYSGAKTPNGDLNDKNIFELYQINLWGKKKLVYTNRQKDEENRKTQLEAIVDRIKDTILDSKEGLIHEQLYD